MLRFILHDTFIPVFDMKNTDIKFSEYVILLDVAFLGGMVRSVREVMEHRLGRELPPLDLVEWLTCLLLDAGVRGGGHQIQVLLVKTGGHTTVLNGCVPSELDELDGKACATSLGECSFTLVTDEGLVTKGHLFFDLLTLLLNDSSLQALLLVPAAEIPDSDVEDVLLQIRKDMGEEAGKALSRTHWFRMAPPQTALPCQWCPVVYSLAHVLGIREDELK